jgi:hypothetical protein
MPYNYIKLMDPVVIASNGTVAPIYTNPALTKSIVGGMWVHNASLGTRTVTAHNVPDSGGSVGTAGVTNQFYKITLDANETVFYPFQPAIMLTDTNDTIQMVANGTAVNTQLLGTTLTP